MQPLVTVVVLSYNSSATIIETLESIAKQTYQNIEIIIADDASKDNTIELVRSWLEKSSLVYKILHSNINTGIPKNCNRGLNASSGEYIKIIAGDDLLNPDCISSNLGFALQNQSDFVFSKPVYFNNDGKTWEDTYWSSRNHLSQGNQYKNLLKDNFIPACTTFIKKEVLQKYGGFSEEFSLFEDYPTWLKLAKKGIRFHYFNKQTVKYRIHTSISNIESSYNSPFYKQLKKFRIHKLLLNQLKAGMFLYAFNLVLLIIYIDLVKTFNLNNKNKIYLYYIVNAFNPMFYLKKVSRKYVSP